MGAVGNLLLPVVPAFIFSIVFTGILLCATVFWSYQRIALVLKYLCITLFCYLIIPFVAETNWKQAFNNTILPNIIFTPDYFMALVGILGTTISPYLFFWQASMEVEEVNRRHVFVNKHIISDMNRRKTSATPPCLSRAQR